MRTFLPVRIAAGLLLAAFITLRWIIGYQDLEIGPIFIEWQTLFTFIPIGLFGILLLWARHLHALRGEKLRSFTPPIIRWGIIALVLVASLLQ